MKTLWIGALLIGTVLFCAALLYPNIFGNQPDAIADESYFLTSALSSIEKHTLPGWEFSQSGAYYGGVQAYVDTVVIIPVVAMEILLQHSVSGAKLWVALHTGDLLHALRLTNTILFGATLIGLGIFFYRRLSQEFFVRFILLAALMCGNSVIFMMVHTAKVWTFYIIFELIAGSLVIAQEWQKERGEQLLSRSTYTALLLWIAAFSFFQTIVGVFSTALWIIWALFLRHIDWKDIMHHLKKWWWLFILTATTQVSFFYRAFFMRQVGSVIDPQANAASGGIDWLHRLYFPLEAMVLSQPFILLFFIVVVFTLWQHRGKLERIHIVAFINPLLVYVFFYLILGFDLATRYALIGSLVASFSIILLISQKYVIPVLAGAGVLAFLVFIHSLVLYWSPSLQMRLLGDITAQLNRNSVVFVVDSTASTFQLPMNHQSLSMLDSIEAQKSRYQFLRQVPNISEDFKPLVLYTHSTEERDLAISTEEKAQKEVYLISKPKDLESFAEPHDLRTFFKTAILGTPYVVEKAPAL